jgi:hypothetical protein
MWEKLIYAQISVLAARQRGERRKKPAPSRAEGPAVDRP